MRIGIIIVFHNNEKEILKNDLIKMIKKAKGFEFCFVNNESTDNTKKVLDQIRYHMPDMISMVEIKKYIPGHMAVKAGFRYMSNQFDLEGYGYISYNSFIFKRFLVEEFITNQKYSFRERKASFKNMVSIIDYVEKLDNSLKP